ncbi:MAG: hypothetical protein V3U75_14195 [Methylococcaceae bacterium]
MDTGLILLHQINNKGCRTRWKRVSRAMDGKQKFIHEAWIAVISAGMTIL